MKTRAYIDIETTGLSKKYHEITVLGIAIEYNREPVVIQLVGDDITAENISKALKDVDEAYSYNGNRFDLPFIQAKTKYDMHKNIKHTDLMYICLKQGYKGGLKSVEKQLGISRDLKDVSGLVAIELWDDFVNNGNKTAFQKLLKYNEEDIVNLIDLRKILDVE